MKKYYLICLPILFGIINAGDGVVHGIDGQNLPLYSILPFVGILLSIAVIPLIAPSLWHHNFGKIAFFWATLFLIPFSLSFGIRDGWRSSRSV